VKLSSDHLLEQASAATGLDDFGELPFRAGLDAQLWAIENESGVAPEQLGGQTAGLVDLLVKRLRLVDDRKQFPEIAGQQIKAPLIVTGLPRTGSTHLHALLATRPGSRAPLQWEMSLPSPPPESVTFASDPRIAAVQAGLESRPNSAELQAIHPFGATRPEQCIGLLDWSFANQAAMSRHYMPSYFAWFLNADHRTTYEHHRRMLQHLQARHPGDWVLKFPKHVFALDAVLATYPDARIVWTHRDPVSVLPSVVSFVSNYRRMSSPLFDPVRFGAEWVAMEEAGLLRAMTFRDQCADPGRFYDVHYNDLMADPVNTVAGIYDHFGMPADDETRARVASFQDDNPKDKHGRHAYTPEQFGLHSDQLRRRFAPYIDKYGVAPDRRREGR
jgi:hypothetical protein